MSDPTGWICPKAIETPKKEQGPGRVRRMNQVGTSTEQRGHVYFGSSIWQMEHRDERSMVVSRNRLPNMGRSEWYHNPKVQALILFLYGSRKADKCRLKTGPESFFSA